MRPTSTANKSESVLPGRLRSSKIGRKVRLRKAASRARALLKEAALEQMSPLLMEADGGAKKVSRCRGDMRCPRHACTGDMSPRHSETWVAESTALMHQLFMRPG